MPSVAEKVVQLRSLLAERFGTSYVPQKDIFCTGLPALDALEIPAGALTEIVGMATPYKSGGINLLLYALLRIWLSKQRAVLIDGMNAFFPGGLRQEQLNQLLWLRCSHAVEAIKAADLVVRDGNISLVILLLMFNSKTELRRIQATAWHRLQMLAEKSGSTLLVITSEAQIQCARLRLGVSGNFPIEELHRFTDSSGFSMKVQRRRLETAQENIHEGSARMVRSPICA